MKDGRRQLFAWDEELLTELQNRRLLGTSPQIDDVLDDSI